MPICYAISFSVLFYEAYGWGGIRIPGSKAKRDLSTLQASDIGRFRDHEAKQRARATAKHERKGFADLYRGSGPPRVACCKSGCARKTGKADYGIQAPTCR